MMTGSKMPGRTAHDLTGSRAGKRALPLTKGMEDKMTVTVVREEHVLHNETHLVIAAAGVPVHLEASLESKDEIVLKVEPDESGWRVMAQSNEEDPDGLVLVLRRY